MGSLFCTGPALIAVGCPNRGTPSFLGTTEGTPRIKVSAKFRDLFNDLAGDVPMDRSYQGRVGMVSCTFTRWNENVLAQIQQANPFSNVLRGTDTPNDIGALMLTEGYTFPLYFAFPFASKAAYAANGMPRGYRFLAAMLNEEDFSEMGTKPRKVPLNFFCLRAFVTANAQQQSGGPQLSTFSSQSSFANPGSQNPTVQGNLSQPPASGSFIGGLASIGGTAPAPGGSSSITSYQFVLYDHNIPNFPIN